jgi:hypothetical protein
MAAMGEDKRCMTQLDPDTVRMLTELRTKEDRSESQMIAILVREAMATRREKAKVNG